MFDLLRTRLGQGRQTTTYPRGDAALPERFRGRPLIECTEGALAAMPSSLVRDRGDGRAALDLGACLFSPEEALDAPGCRIAFTGEVRMATRTRDALVTESGEIELAAALEQRMLKLLGRSLRLRSVVAGSCGGCEAELVAMSNVVFDLARFGVQFVASPRHADGIVITGAVNTNMREALLDTYEAVADPRLVIAVGACPASGGPFRGSPAVAGGVEGLGLPVDLWIPGCPPHPLTILDGVMRLLGRVESRSS